MLKQRADEYFPLREDHEKPHLRWAAGYPEGLVLPGEPKRETYPGYTRYQERIQADVDGMRFWSTVHMLKTHSMFPASGVLAPFRSAVPYLYA